MLQRLIAAVLGVLGVAAIGLGVASATVWRADDPLVATAAPGGETRTLVTDPGVLELAGDPVTVTVRADGAPVVLAVGRDTDVTAWVGADPYERVTGLSDWHTLATTSGQVAAEPSASPSASATEEAAAEAAPSPTASGDAGAAVATAADPTGNDMWVAEVAGDGTATLEWPAQEGRWSLLAVSLGDSAPVLDLSWPQTVTTPWLWPGVALGVLLLAVAAILLVRILRERREGPDAGWTDVSTGTLATVPLPAGAQGGAAGGVPAAGPDGAIPLGTVTPGAPLTRRQIREAEAAAAAARKRGGRTPTGSVPAVTGATPVVTGATPVVTGATPAAAGATPAGTDAAATGPGATPAGAGAATAVPGRAPEAPATRGSGPAAAAPRSGPREDATTTLPVTPAAPADAAGASSTPAAPPAADDDADARPARAGRALADRLPWRRGRSGASEPDPSGPDDATTSPARPAPTGSGPAAGSSAGPAPTASWAPAPAPGPAARPASGPVGSPAPAPSAPPGAASSPAAPRVPGAPTPSAPAPRPGSAPDGPGAAAEDDAATRAQRADAWRRMWGFPSTAEGAATPQDDDTPEEGR
ncbi:hypothetical protein [Cellulomonas sp. Y8]|uniref:hypothetical protein n=1 Tax=Cellulomonas sp. Y8 TaxID=2591145 RepID=UPI003D7599C1